MSQYYEGTVEVTNGTPNVTAVDSGPGATTEWLSEVSIGDLFIVEGDEVWYTVQNVVNDAQLTLSAGYQGDTITASGDPLTGINYSVQRDFTTNYDLPLLSRADPETATAVRDAMDKIDAALKDLDDRVTALEP